MKRALAALAIVLAAEAFAFAEGRAETVVVLPFLDLSGVPDGAAMVARRVEEGFVSRGYRVVDGEPVERLLQASRVRYVDSLTPGFRERMLGDLNAGSALFGVLFQLRPGDDPSAALLLRLVRADGTTAWERFGALSASETQGMFGMGRVTSLELLVETMVSRLQRSLPRPGAVASAASPARAKPVGRATPRTYRAAALPEGPTHRVVVLPFANNSVDLAAGRLASILAAFRLRALGFEVVEPADLRAALLAAGVHSVTNPDPEELKKLSAQLGTGLFLSGTVFGYQQAAPGVDAEVEVDLTLIDVRTGRIVGSVHHQREGRDYSGLLELGAIANGSTLMDQVLAEMIGALQHAKPKGREVS